MSTNLDFVELEDAVVDRLSASSILSGRVAAVTSPFLDASEYPVPPIVLIGINGEQRRTEGNPIGVPLTVKVDATLHVMIVASHFRSRDATLGSHPLLAEIKDRLVGWKPDLADVKRPFVLESSAHYDDDEERKLFFWLAEFSTMTLVREPQG